MFLWLSLVNLFLWVSLLNVQLLLNLSLKTTILCPVRTSINLNQSFSESISTGITTRIWRDSVVLREDIPHALKNLLIQPICVSADLLFNEMWFMFREGSDVGPWGTGVFPSCMWMFCFGADLRSLERVAGETSLNELSSRDLKWGTAASYLTSILHSSPLKRE